MANFACMKAKTFRALGEPTRLQIVELLRSAPLSVGEITEELAVRQPQVSKHLRVLAESSIVAAKPLARKRIYHLKAAPFAEIAEWVDSFERLWSTRLDLLEVYLSSMKAKEEND